MARCRYLHLHAFGVAFSAISFTSYSYIYGHLRANFMLYTYLNSFEKQLHIHGKGRNFYYSFIFWKAISRHMLPFKKHFRAIFSTHAYWQNTLLPTQYTYSLSTSVSHHLGTKKPSWCSAYQMLAQRGAPPNMLSLLCSLTPKIKGLSSYD